MDRRTRQHMIETYGQAGQALEAAVARLPREMWQIRTAVDPWTVHEILVHITDSEANSFVRARRCIAEPGSQVSAYDEDGWRQRLDYHSQNPDEALALFGMLRRSTYQLIKNLPAEVWTQTIEHSANGTMTLEDWLVAYDSHVRDHIGQMERIAAAWQATRA